MKKKMLLGTVQVMAAASLLVTTQTTSVDAAEKQDTAPTVPSNLKEKADQAAKNEQEKKEQVDKDTATLKQVQTDQTAHQTDKEKADQAVTQAQKN